MIPSFYNPQAYVDTFSPLFCANEEFREKSLSHMAKSVSEINFVLDRMAHNPDPIYRIGRQDAIIAREVAPFIIAGYTGMDVFLKAYSFFGIKGLGRDISDEEMRYIVKPIFDACVTEEGEHESLASEAVYAAHMHGYRSIVIATSTHKLLIESTATVDELFDIVTDLRPSTGIFKINKPSPIYEELIKPEIRLAIETLYNRKAAREDIGDDTVVGSLLNVVLTGTNIESRVFLHLR